MRKRTVVIVSLVVGVLAVSGCAKKEPPPTPSIPTEQQPDRPPTQPVEPTPKGTEPTPSTTVLSMSDIYFDYDKADIRADARAILDRNAQWLMDNGDVQVLIEGHCDERGTVEYNLALGQRRADSTMQYLVRKGVAASRVSTISYGEERPQEMGQDESAWSKNRRAHFTKQ